LLAGRNIEGENILIILIPLQPTHPRNIVGGKNVSIERARQGMAKVTIYEDRRKLKYQDELLNAESEAKQAKRWVWSSK
jgi:endonuclease YncB( thermonuclease family)